VYYLLLALHIPAFVFLFKLFESANENGWYSLIPIYNLIILLKIVQIKAFFIIIYLLPLLSYFINQELFFITNLLSGLFTLYLIYRSLISIGKKPYHFMNFLIEFTILSPIIYLVLSSDNLRYDSENFSS